MNSQATRMKINQIPAMQHNRRGVQLRPWERAVFRKTMRRRALKRICLFYGIAFSVGLMAGLLVRFV